MEEIAGICAKFKSICISGKRNGVRLQINPYISNNRCSKQNNKKINRTSYVKYHDTATYKSVVTGHQGNNTIPGQRRWSRSRKREFLIWIFEKAVYETGGRGGSGGSGNSSGESFKRHKRKPKRRWIGRRTETRLRRREHRRHEKETSYVRYHDTAAYKSVVTSHQGNNTILGQRRRSRSRSGKREFLIWIFEKAVYETGGRVYRKKMLLESGNKVRKNSAKLNAEKRSGEANVVAML
ncbi:hypothetical protein YC2023_052746 [Brassica napus]